MDLMKNKKQSQPHMYIGSCILKGEIVNVSVDESAMTEGQRKMANLPKIAIGVWAMGENGAPIIDEAKVSIEYSLPMSISLLEKRWEIVER